MNGQKIEFMKIFRYTLLFIIKVFSLTNYFKLGKIIQKDINLFYVSQPVLNILIVSIEF